MKCVVVALVMVYVVGGANFLFSEIAGGCAARQTHNRPLPPGQKTFPLSQKAFLLK
jgi:hypothetical protein